MEERDPLRLSIVVPAYDEASRIARSVAYATEFLRAQHYAGESIVVPDGSTDATARIARQTGGESVRVIELPVNRGKGFAVRAGVRAARGAHVLFSDVDFSTPLTEVERVLAAHDAGCDVVIGSRALPASQVQRRQAWWRESMGRTFNRVVRATTGTALRDTQCGFKSFRREAARDIFERARIDRYAFDVELLWIARRRGHRIEELPVTWINDPLSRVHPIRDSLRMLWDLGRIRRNAARGVYERES